MPRRRGRERDPDAIPCPRRGLYCALWTAAAAFAGVWWGWLLTTAYGGPLLWLLPPLAIWFAVLALRSPQLGVLITPDALVVRNLLRSRRVPIGSLGTVLTAKYTGALYLEWWPRPINPGRDWRVPMVGVGTPDELALTHLAGPAPAVAARAADLETAIGRARQALPPPTPTTWKLESDRRDTP